MGFISDLFDPEARRKGRIQRLSKKLQEKFGQTEDRMAAAAALREMKDADGMRTLLKRFSVTVDNKLHDQDEKAEVSEMLAEMGKDVIAPILDYVKKENEVTWAFRTLRRVESEPEWIGHVLETLGQHDSEDTDPEKLTQLLVVLQEQKDPRVAPAVVRLLADLDDSIRFQAVETLATLGDQAAREPLLQALTKREEESARVIHRIVEVFRDHDWEVKGFRKTVEERLPEGYYLDRSGRVKRLEAGQAKPAEEPVE